MTCSRLVAIVIPAVLALMAAPVPGSSVLAAQASSTPSGTVAEQPCDPRYWESLTARAWLEAEREIIQNQNLIFKPDSVLEYTCFDQFLNHNANNAGPIFVHTTYFGKLIIPLDANEGMTKGLTNVVAKSLKAYDDGNFSPTRKGNTGKHTFLAGRAEDIKNKGAVSRYPNSESGFTGTTTRTDYGNPTCNVMQEIWKTSKCINFIDNLEAFGRTDGFYPFKKIVPVGSGETIAGYEDSYNGETDPRQWPFNLKCNLPTKQEWEEKNKLAENTAEAYPFKAPLQKVFTDVRERIEPGQCGQQPAIMTGVKVVLTGGQTYDDGVCTNPGCTYTRSGGGSDGADSGSSEGNCQ